MHSQIAAVFEGPFNMKFYQSIHFSASFFIDAVYVIFKR